MFKISRLFDIALGEREGLGTAYEYYVKLRLLDKICRKGDMRPNSVLVLGLPQKYGYSMDFLYFAAMHNANVHVVDDREWRIEEFKAIASLLQESGSLPRVSYTTALTSEWDSESIGDFDLGLSCEVFQRVNNSHREEFVKTITKKSERFVIFAPNAGNDAHVSISGLKTVERSDLIESVEEQSSAISESGLVDSPPFPPGIHLSNSPDDASNAQTFRHSLFRIGSPLLTPFCYLESIYPSFIRKRLSHIVWVSGQGELAESRS